MWTEHRVATCQAPGCGDASASGHLLCWAHWTGAVPKRLRDDCWAAWLRGKEAFGPADRETALNTWKRLRGDVFHVVGVQAKADNERMIAP